MSLVRLNIDGISYSQTQNGAYALILSEVEGNRKLPIVIGASEAQSIAIALEKEIMPPRPLTHDLFKNFSDRFSIIITQVIIHKLVDGVFFSSIICEREGVEEIVDARTSDAIALALRFKAPIFSHKEILDSAGMFLKTGGKKEEKKELEDVVDEFLQNDDSKTPPTESQDYKTSTLKELNQLLEGAVKNEDYEIAAKIRDEISKRD
tara:strand:- start:256 stop:876 length:621 start_codon:yes stop_codon:yes gene_type:complete